MKNQCSIAENDDKYLIQRFQVPFKMLFTLGGCSICLFCHGAQAVSFAVPIVGSPAALSVQLVCIYSGCRTGREVQGVTQTRSELWKCLWFVFSPNPAAGNTCLSLSTAFTLHH